MEWAKDRNSGVQSLGSVEYMILFRHGQHDRRHLGQFTRHIKPQYFKNARLTEIHTHDSGSGKLCETWNATLFFLR